MGAKSISDLLNSYLNKEIPDKDYIFRRVPLNVFLEGRPEHKLDIVPQIFRNEKGTDMSVDWERICIDPRITQTRDDKNADENGVVVLSYFDVKKFNQHLLKVISDQIGYDCHCSLTGIPMSLSILKKIHRKKYDSLSIDEKRRIDTLLLAIREHLVENSFWIITLKNSKLKNPPHEFNYAEKVHNNIQIKNFFLTRKHPIPT